MDPNQRPNQEQALKKNLKKTELGEIYLKHKTTVIALCIVAVLSIIGGSVYYQWSVSNQAKIATSIHEFNQEKLDQYKAKKISDEELLTAFDGLKGQLGMNPQLAVVVLDMAKSLRDQGKLEQAAKVLQDNYEFHKENNYLSYFFNSSLAVVFEEKKDLQNAIKYLETLSAQKEPLMESKVYFDLGRLYKATGDAQKAQQSFLKVVELIKDEDELKKMAQVYLSELKQ